MKTGKLQVNHRSASCFFLLIVVSFNHYSQPKKLLTVLFTKTPVFQQISSVAKPWVFVSAMSMSNAERPILNTEVDLVSIDNRRSQIDNHIS